MNNKDGVVEVNQMVAFRIEDVFHPGLLEILPDMTPELRLRGRILSFTDAGEKERELAVIKVEGIFKPVIVPVSKLSHQIEETGES